MKKLILTSLFMSFFLVSYALALPVDVISQDGPQDPLFVQGTVHEFGDFFPPDEEIYSYWWETEETACFDGSDDPQIPNILVEIQNLTNRTVPLIYVADPLTTISNFDGFVGNAPLVDFEEAFVIDSLGINRPLIFESFIPNNLFEPGEIWHFIIQDFFSPVAAPAPFFSPGIASMSMGDPMSSGSIITPEPATIALLGLGALSLIRRKRRA